LFPYVSALSPLSTAKSVNDGFVVNVHFTRPNASEKDMIDSVYMKYFRTDFVSLLSLGSKSPEPRAWVWGSKKPSSSVFSLWISLMFSIDITFFLIIFKFYFSFTVH
jgi:hypothetical protein